MKTIKAYNPLLKMVTDVYGETLAQDERLFIANVDDNPDFSPYNVQYIIFEIKTGCILCCAETLSDMTKTYNKYKKIYEHFAKTRLYDRLCQRGEKNV